MDIITEDENFVAEEVAENVEQTTEETVVEQPKTFTQEEMNAAVGKGKARERAKVEKQYRREYGELIDVLKAGTGKESIGEMTDMFRGFYEKKGIQIKRNPEYADDDIEILARAEAADIIKAGYEEVAEEVDRLADVGFENLTPREKKIFQTLADHRKNAERVRELSSIGVTEDEYNSAEFQEFVSMFNPNTPITKVYETYRKTHQKPLQTMGSMKQGNTRVEKDFYTPEEISRLTEEDLDDPKVWEAVRRSMTGR